MLLSFDKALNIIQNNGDDRKLKDCFYDYKVNGLTFHHSGSSMVRFSYYDSEKHQSIDGELKLSYLSHKYLKYTDENGKEHKIGCTMPLGDDAKIGGKNDTKSSGSDVEYFNIDTNNPIVGDSATLRSTLNIRFNYNEISYLLDVSEDIDEKNRHMSIKQMAAHLAATYCEKLDKNIQSTDGSQFGAQLTKMILKLGRSDVFDGPELDRAYQLEDYRQAVLQKSAQRQNGKSEKLDIQKEPKVHSSFSNEYHSEKTLQFLKNFVDKSQNH